VLDPLDWYVGQSFAQFGAEHKAVNAVAALGFRTYLPQEVFSRRVMRHGRPVFVDGCASVEHSVRPIFPGYWFVSFRVDSDPWGEILRADCVARLMTNRNSAGIRPTRLPSGFVEAMQAMGRPGDGAIDNTAPALPGYPRGTEGRILEGAFSSFPAKVHTDAGERIFVLAQIFGRETKVELARSAFEPL
jgi:transcriptional antiterminator RfaH